MKGDEHYWNIQSTNWNNVRLKPPQSRDDGWKVELRCLEIQLTSLENAAFHVFILLLVNAILYFNLNFYIPISKVDENMDKSDMVNSIKNQYFYFRKDISGSYNSNSYGFRKINNIINGRKGIMYYIYKYIDILDISLDEKASYNKYLNIIIDRANGNLKTNAMFIRDFVHNHSKYNKDSIISDEINNDLLSLCNKICNGNNLNYLN